MTTERTKSKIGRWVDETMKGKFDNFVGSRKKSTSNISSKTNNEIPVLPDADENIDAELLQSVKPAELHSRMTESAYEDKIMRPPIHLNDIDLGVLFANMAQKEHLENVNVGERDVGMMIQQHLKLLNIASENEN
ncbi:uncharacterized protein LOC112683889 [Sipha flava]|uniref:Uncharacterized protein LOC112683889 n=1 Tax=Sipha flava TaxID=143950 RepID=A0A8B8FKJ2_9HEMI|nr:uncharacterized protein LOC112683889 [Sipha flava]